MYGAGAVGGVVGGRLAQHGHDVVLIARGEHGAAIARDGLRLESPAGSVTLPVPAVDGPEGVDWSGDEPVLLAMKSQHTDAALRRLADAAPPSVGVVCLQNGVANERAALRRFAGVYGVCVMCPAGHLEPGTVVAYSAPTTALLDVGRYPAGVDDRAVALAAAFGSATMESVPRPDIMRWKYRKLVMNLGNAVDAVCGPQERGGPLGRLVREEGEACLRAAGIAVASRDEDRERRGDRLRFGEVPGRPRVGSSSWQSLARGTGSIEADYLNGEVVLLGRLHGVPTPANELLQRLANRLAGERLPPGSVSAAEVMAELGAG